MARAPGGVGAAGFGRVPVLNLKRPAYAKALLDNRRRGFHPLRVDVIYGDDWREAATRAKLEQAVFVKDGLAARPYEDRWLNEVGVPMIALRPREFGPGVFDFRCIVNCAVRVWDQHGASRVCEIDESVQGLVGPRVTRWGVFYDLIAELATWAAAVSVHEAMPAADVPGEDMAQYAQGMRYVDRETRQWCWPRWWSDEIEGNRGKREFYWLGDAGYRAERSTQRVA
jgi:hypothetical protein